jgi:predicted ATP-binding protein involved in virulence
MYYLRTEASEKMLMVGKVNSEAQTKIVNDISDKLHAGKKNKSDKKERIVEKIDADLEELLNMAKLARDEENKKLVSIQTDLISEQMEGSDTPMCTKQVGCVVCN